KRAARHRATRMSHEPRRHATAVSDDRVAPVIEFDELGEQLGAEASTVATDAVDHQSGAVHHAASATAASEQRRCVWCRSNSSAKTRSDDRTNAAAPSGW